jgi:hypothetical protein
MAFTLTLTLGAALVAVWFDVRFPGLRPTSIAAGFIHAALGVFSMFGAVGLLGLVYGIPDGAFMALVIGVFWPTLIYALLAGLWMLRALAELTLAGR